MSDLDERQSVLIKAMRFPLIVMVLFVHTIGSNKTMMSLSFDGWNIYHFISEMISLNFSKIAVCWFFVFSGYFFFKDIPDGGLDWNWLSRKWGKRIRTLLIPYVIWNLLYVIIPFIKTFVFSKLGIPQSSLDEEFQMFNKGPVYWFLTGPANFPLWFLRDLIVMSILSPLVYLLFRGASKWLGAVALSILFLLPFNTPVLEWTGYFFFSLGAFLSIRRRNILELCHKLKWPSVILSVILLLLSTYSTPYSYHDWILRLYFPFGMITLMEIVDGLINYEKVQSFLTKMSSPVFFVFASHAIYILAWTNGLFKRICNENLAGTWIRYILFPFVVLVISLTLYYLLNAIMPRFLAFICGGRSKN